MGGNSKITLEMARHLSTTYDVHFIVPFAKLPTLTQNIPNTDSLTIQPVEDFPKDDKFHPYLSCRWYLPRVRKILHEIDARETDFLFSCSDFHIDVIPAYLLQREFSFRWIPSFFLFVPTAFENIRRNYRFPVAKYVLYHIYQRLLFALAKRRARAFVATNETDFSQFPPRFKNCVFAFYGGVNVEQIPTVAPTKTRDVVFCSRLHPQKGIDAFLDVWALVHKRLPSARLTIIGNGEARYETYLKEKMRRLHIHDSIDWLGYVNNENKFVIYSESKVFVHPTVFDNNGMVAAEALATGLPVVMQDLPSLRNVYTYGCIKVPFADHDAFATEIINLLSNNEYLRSVAPTPDQIASIRDRWNWANRVTEFAQFLSSL